MTFNEREWRELLALNGELADHTSTPAEGLDRLMEVAYRVTRSDEGFLMFTLRGRSVSTGDPLRGWRPVHSIYNRRSEERARIAAEWYTEPSRLLEDTGARRLAATAGGLRVIVRSDLASIIPRGRRLMDSALLAELDVRDRLMVGVPVSADVEVVVGLDRRHGSAFSAEDAERASTALGHLAWFFRRLARHGGILEQSFSNLTPRERETLRGLLTGGTERALAREMGVAASTFHQYVKAVYRKFGVTSRPTLMAHFIANSRPDRRLPLPRFVVEHEGRSEPEMGIVAL